MATFKPTQTAYPEKVENKVAAWLNVIPSTSILMMGILLMMKPDDFFEFISTSANYFGVSDRIMMMGLGAFGVAVMAIAQCGLWIKDYFVEREKQRKEGIEIAQKEREALITFFESTNGKKCWKDKTRWCSSEPLKKWKGVHLDPETGRVSKIILPDNNLTGIFQFRLSRALQCHCLFKYVLTMTCSNSLILGDLPGPLFLDLAYLKELDLRQNQISGRHAH